MACAECCPPEEPLCPACSPGAFENAARDQGFVPPEAFTTVLEFVRTQGAGLELLRLSLLDYPEVAERVRRFDLEGH